MHKPSLSKFIGDGPTLIVAYLEEQQNLTAVEKFSSAHDAMHGLGGIPSLEKHYRDLLPTSKPISGQQYGFEVDLDRCSGCKACVTACHNLNGLDDDETWRSVGLIHNVLGKPLQQTVTTACQHCLEPGCAHGCPVKAYEKDPVTGIVKHLDDQCIGCEYCILKCPYDVPQYHKGKGIVRKCDMCVGRLEVGEAPACVQSCPTKAIRISIVNQSEVREHPENFTDMPGTPDPTYTYPTTRYTTTRKFPESMEAADAYKIHKEKAHFPLVFMLTLSQMAAGFLFALETGSLLGILPVTPIFQALGHVFGASIMSMAILISIFHLGRPLYAFRAILGFRRSWLSREIVVFGLFGSLAILAASTWLIKPLMPFATMPALRLGLILFAILAIHCSAMVYRDTPRIFWATKITSLKFFLSAAITGSSGLLLFTTIFHNSHLEFSYSQPSFLDRFALSFNPQSLLIANTLLIPILLIAKFICEAQVLKHIQDKDANPLKKAALLLQGQLKHVHRLRFYLGLFGGFIIPIFMLFHGFSNPGIVETIMALSILFLLLSGELLERYLFFTTCIPPRMPGS